jgi:hypothetical protein
MNFKSIDGGDRALRASTRLVVLWVATALLLGAIAAGAPAVAASGRVGQIRIEYTEPKSPAHQPIFKLIKEHRVLERIREVLSPIRLPRPLLLKTSGCDGVSNAWYEERAVTVCYEYLDEIWQNVPEQATPAGLAPIDTFVGPLVDVFLHEAGHAVFDLLKVPLFGREEDAADQFSAYLMLKLGKQEVKRLIAGSAYQYKSDLSESNVSVSLATFANEHGTPAQRFYNLLCVAYGSDEKLFADVVTRGYLPKDRAEGCKDEYRQVVHAFETLIGPHIDRRRAKRLRHGGLPPENTPMPKFHEPGGAPPR